jgi:hypothetical protein
VVECGGLESHCALLGTGGSNPLPSAMQCAKRDKKLTLLIPFLTYCINPAFGGLYYSLISQIRNKFHLLHLFVVGVGSRDSAPSFYSGLFFSPIWRLGTIPPKENLYVPIPVSLPFRHSLQKKGQENKFSCPFFNTMNVKHLFKLKQCMCGCFWHLFVVGLRANP